MQEVYSVNTGGTTPYPRTPGQHAALLHPPKAKGRATVARLLPNPDGWKEENWEPWELEDAVYSMAGQTDTYLSQNRFRGARRAVARVLKLCGLYCDVDFYSVDELRRQAPEAVYEMALERLREAGIPDPSLALSSGRGLYLIWRHIPVDRKRQPEWSACQDRIYRVLKPLGADPKAREAARVLRIAGTTNSKNGATVRSLADVAESEYRFEDLTDALVKKAPASPASLEPEDRNADVYSIAVERAARGLRNHPQGWSEASLWEGRLTDLQHLRELRYGKGRMEDFRDRWLFIACTAISWLAPVEVLHREVFALAEEAGGWDERLVRSDLSTVLKRARLAARGEKIEFAGRMWDPRHHFHNETIAGWLEISPEEEKEMVVLISDEERRRRDREYRREKRRAEGVPTRSEYEDKRSAALARKVANARQLKKCNLSTKDIAASMEVSERTVQRWLR